MTTDQTNTGRLPTVFGTDDGRLPTHIETRHGVIRTLPEETIMTPEQIADLKAFFAPLRAAAQIYVVEYAKANAPKPDPAPGSAPAKVVAPIVFPPKA